ncbi:lipoprotein heptaprenylglyceryl N-acetyltransferase LhaT [Bacillus sp. AK128]
MFQLFLAQRWVLWTLLAVNVAGTIYGYEWYGWQLADTPPIFLIFVPDSPTASLFFAFVLIAFILKKNWPIFEALAIVTLFKYGVWAVVMNLLVLSIHGDLAWQGYMLIFSHAAMAVQGLLYAPYYRMKLWHLILAAVWTLHNDVIDYVFFMYPRYRLEEYIASIGYFTFWLSIASLLITYILCIRKNRVELSL